MADFHSAMAAATMGGAPSTARIRPVEIDEEEQFIVHSSRRRQQQDGWLATLQHNYSDLLPLIVLVLLAIGVLVYNVVRPKYDACDAQAQKAWAKHFYCFNATKALGPGVHVDNKAG